MRRSSMRTVHYAPGFYPSGVMAQTTTTPKPTSNESELLQLMDKTGYNIVQENGQRKYGPPPDWTGPPPPKGSEVFVGKIPRDLYEDELVPTFERYGKIYEIRLMMDFSGSNRGYAFVMYTNPADAKKAVKELDNYEIRKGRFIGVCKSVDNCRLFVGGIPKTKTREEILDEMQKITEGVVDVILYSSVTDKTKNRGFAFVEYENHRAAAMARRKLIPGKIQLWGHEIAVDWAEPEPEVDEEVMSKVTVLYARNFMLSTTEDQITDAFSLNGQLKVEKVKKLRDFAFIHYKYREEAERALQEMNKAALDGVILEVTWAKPADRAGRQRSRNTVGSVIPASCLSHQWSTMNSLFPVYSQVYPVAPPLNGPGTIAPRGSPVRVRSRGAAGMRGPRPLTGGFIPRPFGRPVDRFINVEPGMQLVPTNPFTLKPYRFPSQVLLEVCQKNNWGEPQYQLHSSQHGGDNGQSAQFFLFKVTIPNLHPQYSQYNNFHPTKLSQSVNEAKEYAAEYVLSQLGISPEGLDGTAPIPHSQLVVAAPPGSGGGSTHGLPVPSPQGRPLHPGGYPIPLGGSCLPNQSDDKHHDTKFPMHPPSSSRYPIAPPATSSAANTRVISSSSSSLARMSSTFDHGFFDHPGAPAAHIYQ